MVGERGFHLNQCFTLVVDDANRATKTSNTQGFPGDTGFFSIRNGSDGNLQCNAVEYFQWSVCPVVFPCTCRMYYNSNSVTESLQ